MAGVLLVVPLVGMNLSGIALIKQEIDEKVSGSGIPR